MISWPDYCIEDSTTRNLSFSIAYIERMSSDTLEETHEHSSGPTWTFPMLPLAFLISLAILLASMIAGRFVQKKKLLWMSDAGMALLLGILLGGFMLLVGVSTDIDNMITFKFPIFIDVLLPMIMW